MATKIEREKKEWKTNNLGTCLKCLELVPLYRHFYVSKHYIYKTPKIYRLCPSSHSIAKEYLILIKMIDIPLRSCKVSCKICRFRKLFDTLKI